MGRVEEDQSEYCYRVLSILAVYPFSSLVDLSRTKTVTRKVVQCRVFEECVLISWNETRETGQYRASSQYRVTGYNNNKLKSAVGMHSGIVYVPYRALHSSNQ